MKLVALLFALFALSGSFAAAQSSPPVMYLASVRWLDYLPLWCEVVLSTVDKLGNVNDLGQIIPSIWCDDIYYPTERQTAASADGMYYYYAVTTPGQETSQLYIFNTKAKSVSQVSIPAVMSNNNGQPLRSIRYAAPGLIAGVYGNVLAMVNTTTGQVMRQSNIWHNTFGCNATKYSGSDLDFNNIYVECFSLSKAKPCQYIFGVNLQTGKVQPAACMPGNKGLASMIGYVGGWNATSVITVNNNMMGPAISVLNPITGTWGETFDTFQTFVDHKISWDGPGKAVWDKNNKLMYMTVTLQKDANQEGMVTFDIANKGHLVYKKPLTKSATWEGYELIPNQGK